MTLKSMAIVATMMIALPASGLAACGSAGSSSSGSVVGGSSSSSSSSSSSGSSSGGSSSSGTSTGDTLTGTTALAQMAPGWNLGNSLEAIGTGTTPFTTSQETVWGNPAASQALMDAVKAAGFKSVRIPVSWSQYADASGNISPFWMNRVTEVVNYARNSGLYVIVNVHWDGGWIQPTYAQQATVNAKLNKFWTQIATNFKDYDYHLLFAGTNEIAVTGIFGAPTSENCAVQNGFNQVFVNAVRAAGGSNATRFLIVQGYNTNIDYTVSCNATLPADSASSKLMMEVHFYDPYDFTLNTGSTIWQWGAIATDPSATEAWANEAYTDAEFQKMKTNFIDKGIPVILGEYAADQRTEYDAAGKYRNYWGKYVSQSAYQHGIVPIYWDDGYIGNHASGLFNRSTATPGFPETITEIVNAAK